VRGRKGQHRDVLAWARDHGITRARIDGKGARIAPDMALHRSREHDIDLEVAHVEAGAHAHDLLSAAITRAAGLGDGSVCVLPGDAPGDEIWLSTRRACPRCGRGFAELDPRMFSFNTRQGACAVCEGRGVIEHEAGSDQGSEAADETLGETCTACQGTRLSPLARAVTVAGRPITDILCTNVERARAVVQSMGRSILQSFSQSGALSGREAVIGALPIAEAERRLGFLDDVGLGYLGLDRAAPTLSGGEMQRVRLAAQLGSGLTGVLYVLDEPTIGLHPRDTGRLLSVLRGLVDRGNSAVVVEHDLDTIAAADHIIDMGPGGGRLGGRIVARGSVADIRRNERSVTGKALARPAPVPASRRLTGARPWPHGALDMAGARAHNLRDIDVSLPLQALVVVTGVSGSGKTTLVREILLPAVKQALGLATEPPGAHASLRGADALRRAVEIDQSPIGRTPRSVPATYIDIWTPIRKLLARTPEARVRGYGPSRFSFNVPEGRCAVCEGQGALRVEMSFLPEVHLPCDACRGLRFDADTLAVTWRGMNAGQILDLEVGQAIEHFAAAPKVLEPLRLLDELGLGYLKLGQPSSTLSGGEAQRVKLASELGGRASGGTLYVMDEPTTGLHRDDVARVIAMVHRLVDRGDTVVVIEHHPDMMVSADWIIDLGPEGGERGGRVVTCGTPEQVASVAESHTGAAIATELARASAMSTRP
jgi:excinuclease ABC subunit A